MIRLLKTFCALCLFSSAAMADGERAGDFDYYVLALSWTPNWCALEGDDRDAPECDAGTGRGFSLHGLWPQYENGWPSYCRTRERDPSRSDTAAMADIMGSSGLAWHQWKKHGRCSGLSSDDYYAAAREAYENVNRPDVLRRITEQMSLPPNVIEAAFIEANPEMTADGITVTCKSSMIQEVRICLTKDLEPRECGADTIRDCSYNATLDPIR